MMNRLINDYTTSMIDELHKEANKRLDMASQCQGKSEANYIANMTAALVLGSLASAYMATRKVDPK